MSDVEVVAIEYTDGRDLRRLRRADQSTLTVIKVLEYWRNPRLGQVAAATLKTTEAYRLLVTADGGEPYEVSIRQHGAGHAGAWHMRTVEQPVVDTGQLRAALREAMVERARQAFARGVTGASPEDTVASLTFINATQGFLLDIADQPHHNVKFQASEWQQILDEARKKAL